MSICTSRRQMDKQHDIWAYCTKEEGHLGNHVNGKFEWENFLDWKANEAARQNQILESFCQAMRDVCLANEPDMIGRQERLCEEWDVRVTEPKVSLPDGGDGESK